jgi:pimeloyl-ACP methyl ester carboxylesterase
MPVDLHTREAGSGRPLVLLHAFPLSSAMWLAQREALAGTCRVLTPDLRGFGGSPQGSDEPSLDEMADDVAALLDAKNLDRVVLGGLSMGGYVAMAFARRHPERLHGLVLADTKASADTEEAKANRLRIADAVEADPESEVLLDAVLPALLGETTKARRAMVAGRVKALVQAAPATAVAWAQRAMADRPDSLESLRAVSVPALVVVGDEDVLSPPEDAHKMVEALPDGQLAVLAGAGHLSAVETPEAFAEAVAAYLGRLPADGTAG